MKKKLSGKIRRQNPGTWLGFCLLLSLSCLSLVAIPVGSQNQSQQRPDIAVESKLVNVLATVRDKHGAIVRTLTKDDFILEEDGHPQTIQYFSQDSNLPLTLGLLVDTSMSQRSVLGDERSASYTFLDHVLHEDKDKAFLIHFDHEVELLQDLTSSRQKLQSSIQLIEPTRDDNSSGSSGGDPRSRGGGGGRMGAGTLLYDAVYLASDDVMKTQQGRKAVIILSDGVDRGSKESLADAIESAQRADTIVYSILFTGDEGNRGGGFGGPRMGGPMGGGGGHRRFPEESRPDGKKVLEQISKETGGRLFEVSKKETIDQIYGQIEEELRNQYSLGYTPAAGTALGYHKIGVTAKPKDLTVQARDGYYVDR
jgi:VWFA-related protein